VNRSPASPAACPPEPYLAFHRYSVGVATPTSRATSAALQPAGGHGRVRRGPETRTVPAVGVRRLRHQGKRVAGGKPGSIRCRRQLTPLKRDGRPLRGRLGDRQGACRYTAHGVPHHDGVGVALKSNN